MKFLNKKGNVLLFAVVAMTAISVLGTGIYFMTTTSTFSGLGANDQNRAYQLAVAGRDYALAKNLTAAEGGYFTFTNGDKFHLVISSDTITSTGIVKKDTPYEAKRTITTTKTGFGSQPDISFAKDIQAFTAPEATKAGLITTDTGAGQISLGKIGDEWKSSFGALWYKGAAVSGNCTNGRCDFGTGFRAFFVFTISASAAGADGFTFTFFNGDTATNDVYSVGGHPDMGELLGYAGDSRIDSGGTSFLDGNNRTTADYPGILGHEVGRGIQPPKIAIEFDPYINQFSGCPVPITNDCLCSNSTVCFSDSRCDDTRNHMAYVYWGDNSDPCFVTTVGKNTYDDNKHGAGTDGSSTVPQNSRSPISTGGMDTTSYYDASATTWASNWLLSNAPNIYAFRVEVTRSKTPNAGGNYEYTVKSWVKQCAVDIACATYGDASSFANTKVDYDYTADVPTLTRSTPIALESTLHQKFDTFFFGWTTATGGATQNILINRFKINFRN